MYFILSLVAFHLTGSYNKDSDNNEKNSKIQQLFKYELYA